MNAKRLLHFLQISCRKTFPWLPARAFACFSHSASSLPSLPIFPPISELCSHSRLRCRTFAGELTGKRIPTSARPGMASPATLTEPASSPSASPAWVSSDPSPLILSGSSTPSKSLASVPISSPVVCLLIFHPSLLSAISTSS